MHKGQIPEDHYPMIQNLELNRHIFENNVRRRVHKLEEFNFQLIDDEKCAFYDDVGEVCRAEWHFLAQFEILDTESEKPSEEPVKEEPGQAMKLLWTWSWVLCPDNRNEPLKKVLDDLVPTLDCLKNNQIALDDPMVASYILGFYTYQLNYEYVHIVQIGKTNTVFCLKNINFTREKDPELCKKIDQQLMEDIEKIRQEMKTDNDLNKESLDIKMDTPKENDLVEQLFTSVDSKIEDIEIPDLTAKNDSDSGSEVEETKAEDDSDKNINDSDTKEEAEEDSDTKEEVEENNSETDKNVDNADIKEDGEQESFWEMIAKKSPSELKQVGIDEKFSEAIQQMLKMFNKKM